MSDIRRLGAIKRLYMAKLENMPANMPYEERCEGAKRKLDEVLGKEWREEVKRIDLGPIDGEDTSMKHESFQDRLASATRAEGFHGDAVEGLPLPNPKHEEGNKDNEDDENEGGIVSMLMRLIHGK